MPECSAAVQFFAGSPRLHQLTALHVMFEKPGDDAPGKQVLRCRELIFRCASVLSSPDDDGGSVLVVCPRAFDISRPLGEMRARVLEEWPASAADFTTCLRYTLRAKLAPQWNVVGDLLVQGRQFLQVTGALNAVRLQVHVTEADICLSALACVIRLPRLALADVGASPGAVGDFTAHLVDSIGERQLSGRWCHNLPSMKKGQVMGVSRRLLPSGPFSSYKDLKRHWKNMYGYRLPEEEPPHYVHINFRLVGPQLFTYPPYCLRSAAPVFLPRPAPRPILTALLRDLHVKVSAVCGRPLTFSGTPSYLTTQLQPAPLVGDRPNLSSTPVHRLPPPVHRQVSLVPSFAPTRSSSAAAAAGGGAGSSGERPGAAVVQEQAGAGWAIPSDPARERPDRQNGATREDSKTKTSGQRGSSVDPVQPQASSHHAALTAPAGSGMAQHRPVPLSQCPQPRPPAAASVQNTSATAAALPASSPAKQQPIAISKPSAYNGPAETGVYRLAVPSAKAEVTRGRDPVLVSPGVGLAPAGPAGPPLPSSPTPAAEAPGTSKDTGLTPCDHDKPPSVAPARLVPVFRARSKQSVVHHQPPPSVTSTGSPPPSRAASFTPSQRPSVNELLRKAQRPAANKLTKAAAAGAKQASGGGLKTPAVKRPVGAPKPPPAKKPAADAAESSSQGKPKKSAARQEVDVEALAGGGQLQRASAAALVDWLRARGQTCASRTLKPLLMQRVQACLGLPPCPAPQTPGDRGPGARAVPSAPQE